jgi:predicted Fe-S protein YdhL (DUF1289 family)
MSDPTNLIADASDNIPPDAPELATPVPSPCVSLCKMDADRMYCMGCLRTIPELVAWGKADDAYKRGVWAEIRRRREFVTFDEEAQ